MKYKYRKTAGALNQLQQAESAGSSTALADGDVTRALALDTPLPQQTMASFSNLAPPPSPSRSHGRAVGGRPDMQFYRGHSPGDFDSSSGSDNNGLDPSSQRGGRRGMWYYTVEDGQRVLMIESNGHMKVLTGPCKVWQRGRRFRPMAHHVAHPGEFLIVRFRDGRQEHIEGPADVWLDPRIHLSIDREDTLQLAAKEAVVVYRNIEEPAEDAVPDPSAEAVSRRIVYGPATFMPQPGEWLHNFSWHGSMGESDGYRKIPNALVFQKLWMMPDQMYHNIEDVRTADDAVLTIRLMIFFELLDIETMLEATHDPIGDFINAATSDVVDFTGRLTFTEFKRQTHQLNELETYKQLVVRAEKSGYRINKVVYRGYGAPRALQQMHDQAIESRTRLQLEKETERQAQDLQDTKLERELARADKQREAQQRTVAHEITLAEQRQSASIERQRAQQAFERGEQRAAREQALVEQREINAQVQAHLAALQGLGVDLTQYLTQGRADRVIEVRGRDTQQIHLHTTPNSGEG